MGIYFKIVETTGRAKCQFCQKKIEKGLAKGFPADTQIRVWAYKSHDRVNYHRSCLIQKISELKAESGG